MKSWHRWVTLATGMVALGMEGAALASAPQLDLRIALDPEEREIRAVAEFTASKKSRVRLYETLVVTGAFAQGHPVAVRPGEIRGGMREWALSATDGARIRIEYGGRLAALDRALSDREVLRAMPPMAAATGTFLPSDSGWYPRPAPLFTYRVTLSLPGAQRGVVAGHLVSESLPHGDGGRYVATFRFAHPAQGIDLMAGPYVVNEELVPRRGLGPLRLRTYFFPELGSYSGDYLDASRRFVELYSGEIGPYPFDDFSVVASPLPTGFGMPTLTYIGAEVLKLPFIRSRSLGHEVLHNWWGNGVYVDYAKGNWSEGLTTFMADFAYKERESAEAAREMRLGWLRDFASLPEGFHQPLSEFRSRAHGAEAAVGYGKSAMVFFMLRDAIGKDAFDLGIRKFWERHKFKIASWDDLRTSFEQASGRNLDSYFTQWIRRSGGPTVRIARARAVGKDGDIELFLTMEQNSPAYALHVPVELSAGGRLLSRTVDFARERETAVLDLDAVPQGVRLDPGERIWRTLDPEEMPPILRQWIIAKAPRLAIASSDAAAADAARALAARFFEATPQVVAVADADSGKDPVLIIGLDGDVDATLAKLGLPPPPAAVAARGSARIWTVRRPIGSAPIAAVSGKSPESISALLRPLPHYGSQSYLAFDGGHVIAKGIWPAATPLVPVAR